MPKETTTDRLKGKRILITGGAGFIGSNFADMVIKKVNRAVVYDNLSSGNEENIAYLKKNPKFAFVEGDLLDSTLLGKTLEEEKPELIVHLAANPDVRIGINNTKIDIEQGVLATYNLLDAMRKHEVKDMLFASSSTVYGEATVKPTPEDYGPLKPISLYGAAKLACEGMITAYSHMFDINYHIFRFANVIGNHALHGAIIDFANKLKHNPSKLEVLGDGTQKKAYVLVEDCIEAMLYAYNKSGQNEIFNISVDDQITVKEIAEKVTSRVSPKASINYTGGKRGWKGDVADAFLSNEKLKALGWMPKKNSAEAVDIAIGLVLGS
ncbi:MAG: NAD-dependent epimerase/dehydratase family protein [Candidatus Marsarchaeota archaeon]|nr:NAD-dependent epimerase/dehydratase family protein [Candidatus Marsarchaeota archaeon]